jgi:predicted O-methyltransferase YrrM
MVALQYIVLFLSLTIILIVIIKHKPLYPLMPFRYNFKKRRATFSLVLDLLTKGEAKNLVETGTAREGLKGVRSQGASTIVFGKWAKLNNAKLNSVDLNEDSVRVAQKEVDNWNLEEHVTIHHSDSIKYLSAIDRPIDFLYLDSYDYSTDPEVQLKSQEHHLAEFKTSEHNLHDNSIVLIDDCALPGGGKGKLAIEYMISKGWRVILEKYQVVLLHMNSNLS